MKNDRRALRYATAIAVVAILIATSITAVFVPGNSSRQMVFTGTVISVDKGYGNPVFDITYDDLSAEGFVYGDTFDVTVKDRTIHDAILSKNYMGTFMFDTYLNVNSSDNLSAGTMWINVLSSEKGNTVTISYTGHNSDYDKLDRFLSPYSNNRSDFKDDAAFANFYEITGGDIKSGKLYRSFSPFTVKNPRIDYVNALAEEKGIRYDLALSYSDAAILLSGANGYYCYDELFLNGECTAYNLTYHYLVMKDEVKAMLNAIADNEGPYLMHCNVGRDRTGFMSTLIQALCGADEDTMKTTAAQAYVNLYGVDPNSEEYMVIVSSTYCRNMYFISNYDEISFIFSPVDNPKLPVDWSKKSVDGIDTRTAAEEFCTEYLGLDQSVITKIRVHLCQ